MRYTHDCDKCIPLGTCYNYDLYFCNQEIGGQTIIARWGNEGEEYYSGLDGKNTFPLNRAYRRAIERGILKTTNKPINWRCKCSYGDNEYFISCPVCGKENLLDGKGNPLN